MSVHKKDYSGAYTKRNVGAAPPPPPGYNTVNVDLTKGAVKMPEKKLTLKNRMDRFFSIFVPVATGGITIGLIGWLEYLIITWTWQHWVETVNTNSIHKWQMLGHYHHATSTDIILGLLLGVLALGMAIACAYWAEDWHKNVTR